MFWYSVVASLKVLTYWQTCAQTPREMTGEINQ